MCLKIQDKHPLIFRLFASERMVAHKNEENEGFLQSIEMQYNNKENILFLKISFLKCSPLGTIHVMIRPYTQRG